MEQTTLVQSILNQSNFRPEDLLSNPDLVQICSQTSMLILPRLLRKLTDVHPKLTKIWLPVTKHLSLHISKIVLEFKRNMRVRSKSYQKNRFQCNMNLLVWLKPILRLESRGSRRPLLLKRRLRRKLLSFKSSSRMLRPRRKSIRLNNNLKKLKIDLTWLK
jgi:hypothetical protein